MATVFSFAARCLAAAGCVSMTASPALAASLPQVSVHSAIDAPRTWTPAYDRAYDRGRGGWGHGRHHRDRDDGISAGDVFVGLLVLGGIAAIASSASKKDKENDDYRYRGEGYDEAPPPPPEQGNWGNSRSGASQAMDNAVDSCVRAAGREGSVEEVYGAQRTGRGFQVGGRLAGGKDFACTTGADGWVEDLNVDGRDIAGFGRDSEGESGGDIGADDGYDGRYETATGGS